MGLQGVVPAWRGAGTGLARGSALPEPPPHVCPGILPRHRASAMAYAGKLLVAPHKTTGLIVPLSHSFTTGMSAGLPKHVTVSVKDISSALAASKLDASCEITIEAGAYTRSLLS